MTIKFEDNSKQVENAINKAAKQWLLEASGEMQAQTQRNTPVDTGELKSSWEYIVRENEAVIGSQLENALWEEFGTGEYSINGGGRKGYWFVPVEGYTGSKHPTYKDEVVVVYGKNGKQYFKTDGKKGTRPLNTAYTKNKTKMIRRAQSIFKMNLGG